MPLQTAKTALYLELLSTPESKLTENDVDLMVLLARDTQIQSVLAHKANVKTSITKTKASQSSTDSDRRDVVVYQIETRKITNIVGRDLGSTGHHTYTKRVDTLLERCNEHYGVAAVPVGKYKVNDLIDAADL
jgi:hypothetical protein